MSGRSIFAWLIGCFSGETRRTERDAAPSERTLTPQRENTTRDRPSGWAELDQREIADILIHRTQMRMINADDQPEIAVRTILDSPFTRMPVWRGSTDNIIGVLHAKDLLRALAEPGASPETLEIMRIADRPWFVPDTTSLREQLSAFLKRNTHFAIVVDEYGEMQGMVTMQDILEDVLGDVSDEREVGLTGVRKEADGGARSQPGDGLGAAGQRSNHHCRAGDP
jgi:Mg2+/Co2+ transporter CorB